MQPRPHPTTPHTTFTCTHLRVLTRACLPAFSRASASLIEDYIVLSIGFVSYKIVRLLLLALMCVHISLFVSRLGSDPWIGQI